MDTSRCERMKNGEKCPLLENPLAKCRCNSEDVLSMVSAVKGEIVDVNTANAPSD